MSYYYSFVLQMLSHRTPTKQLTSPPAIHSVSLNEWESAVVHSKSSWTATKNGTYWAAAKLLAMLAHEKEVAKIMSAFEKKNTKIVLAQEKMLAKITGRKTAETAEASNP